ncbi:MAG: hypothetical protein JSW33_01560 [bacterium]|nr:MAG: hypothetical protein JSW33_01560 [bacterium]
MSELKFPFLNPGLSVCGKGTWCSVKEEHVLIGVELLDENDACRTRIIEEICHISDVRWESLAESSIN